MAKLESNFFSSIRGALAGTVFSTSSSGIMTARRLTRSVPRPSVAQTAINNSFASASAVWRSFSDVNRKKWNAYADAIGSHKPGRLVFIGIYSLAVYVKLRHPAFPFLNTNPPTILSPFLLDNIRFSRTVSNPYLVTVRGFNPNSRQGYAIVERSFPCSKTRNYPTCSWDPNATLFAYAPSGSNFAAYFYGLLANSCYFFRVRLICSSGPLRISSPWILRAITYPP